VQLATTAQDRDDAWVSDAIFGQAPVEIVDCAYRLLVEAYDDIAIDETRSVSRATLLH
jgi:hypothetical protein